jgi:hypothetical protein
MAPTKIKPVATVGYSGKPQVNLDDTLKINIQEQTIK